MTQAGWTECLYLGLMDPWVKGPEFPLQFSNQLGLSTFNMVLLDDLANSDIHESMTLHFGTDQPSDESSTRMRIFQAHACPTKVWVCMGYEDDPTILHPGGSCIKMKGQGCAPQTDSHLMHLIQGFLKLRARDPALFWGHSRFHSRIWQGGPAQT